MRIFLFLLFIFSFVESELVRADVSSAQLAFQEAVMLRESGNFEEAERRLTMALQEEPDNADYHFELANIYATAYDKFKKSGNFSQANTALDQAANQFRQTAMIRPQYVAAYFNLGIIYKNQGEYEKAREEFRTVLQLDPESVPAWMQIGAVYEAQGFYNEAEDAYKQAKELDFFNPYIQSTIDDLDHNRTQRRQLQSEELSRQFASLNRNFRYSAFSHASDYEKERQMSYQQSQGVAAAIPYVASALIDEFMRWKARSRGEE